MNGLVSDKGKLSVKSSATKTKLVSTKMLWKVDKRGVDDGQIYTPTDVAFLPKGILVCCELENERLQLFDQHGDSLYVIGEGDMRPRGLLAEQIDGNIAVTCERDQTVKMFTGDGGIIGTWKKRLFGKPHGIAVTSDDKFVVTDLDESKPKVHVFEPEGLRISSFGSAKQGNDDYIVSPNYCAIDQHDRIIISDWLSHCIKIYDINGKLVQKFGNRGNLDGQLRYPNGVFVDYHNNIVVADNGNHRISLFSQDGKFIQHILTENDGISWPEGVAVSDSGMLAITEFGLDYDTIKVYQL